MKRKAKDERTLLYFDAQLPKGNRAKEIRAEKRKSDNRQAVKTRKGKYRMYVMGETIERRQKPVRQPFNRVHLAFPIAGFSFDTNVSGEKITSKKQAVSLIKRKFLKYAKNKGIENKFSFDARVEWSELIVMGETIPLKNCVVTIAEIPFDPDSTSKAFSGYVYRRF